MFGDGPDLCFPVVLDYGQVVHVLPSLATYPHGLDYVVGIKELLEQITVHTFKIDARDYLLECVSHPNTDKYPKIIVYCESADDQENLNFFFSITIPTRTK